MPDHVVTDQNGQVHRFPDEATPEMIAQALGVNPPSQGPNLKTGQGMQDYANQKAKQVLTGTGDQGNYNAQGVKVSGPSGEPLSYMEKAEQDQAARQTRLGAAQNRAMQSPMPFTNASMAYAPVTAAKSLIGAKLGGAAGGAIAPQLSNSPEAENYGEFIGGTLGGVGASVPWGQSAKNAAASALRNPATARQSQMGKPGTVKDFLPPQLQKWSVPPWMVPKGEVGTPTNPGPFMEIPARMPKVQPELGSEENPGLMSKIPTGRASMKGTAIAQQAADAAEAAKPQLNQVASEEGVPGSVPKPSGRLVVLPQEAQALDQMDKIAKARASQHGMLYAAGIRPAGGGRVPMTPTGTTTTEFPGARAAIPQGDPTPFSPSLARETDSLGIRWAVSPEGYRVSIPKSVPEEGVETYARTKLAEQAQMHSSLPWMKTEQQ
jgi:hypothetical protein